MFFFFRKSVSLSFLPFTVLPVSVSSIWTVQPKNHQISEKPKELLQTVECFFLKFLSSPFLGVPYHSLDDFKGLEQLDNGGQGTVFKGYDTVGKGRTKKERSAHSIRQLPYLELLLLKHFLHKINVLNEKLRY